MGDSWEKHSCDAVLETASWQYPVHQAVINLWSSELALQLSEAKDAAGNTHVGRLTIKLDTLDEALQGLLRIMYSSADPDAMHKIIFHRTQKAADDDEAGSEIPMERGDAFDNLTYILAESSEAELSMPEVVKHIDLYLASAQRIDPSDHTSRKVIAGVNDVIEWMDLAEDHGLPHLTMRCARWAANHATLADLAVIAENKSTAALLPIVARLIKKLPATDSKSKAVKDKLLAVCDHA